MRVVVLQEKTLVSTGKVRDEIGECRAEVPLGSTWGWEVVTRWPCVHPLSASHHPCESFVVPTLAGCLSVLLSLSGILAGPGEFCHLVWWEFGDFGSPALTRRGWQKMARLVHLPLLVAGCHIISLSSRLESRGQGSMNTQMVVSSLASPVPPVLPGLLFLGWCALGEGALSLPAGSFKHLFRGGKDSSSTGDQGGSWAPISAVGRHIVPLGGTGGSCWALLPPAMFLPSAMCKHELEWWDFVEKQK